MTVSFVALFLFPCLSILNSADYKNEGVDAYGQDFLYVLKECEFHCYFSIRI